MAEKKEEIGEKIPLSREAVRARTSTLWLSGEGDQKVESRSIRKGVRGHPAIYERPAKLISRWQKLLLQEVAVLFLFSFFISPLPLPPSISLTTRSHTEVFRFFSSRCDSSLGYRILPSSQRYGESFVALGIVDCTENRSHILQFFTILSERYNLILYLIALYCCYQKYVTKLTPAFESTNTKKEIQAIYRNYLEISFCDNFMTNLGKWGMWVFWSCNLQLNSPAASARFLRIGFFLRASGLWPHRFGTSGSCDNTLLENSEPIFDLHRWFLIKFPEVYARRYTWDAKISKKCFSKERSVIFFKWLRQFLKFLV